METDLQVCLEGLERCPRGPEGETDLQVCLYGNQSGQSIGSVTMKPVRRLLIAWVVVPEEGETGSIAENYLNKKKS